MSKQLAPEEEKRRRYEGPISNYAQSHGGKLSRFVKVYLFEEILALIIMPRKR